jgi:predicted dehydrogenase
MTKDRLGFGILGAGLVAPFHAKGIVHATGGELIAFCDVDETRVNRLAAEYGVRAYRTLDEMLADTRIDVINVALPNHLHYDAVMKCAGAGKHVLTEKPPAMTLRETDAMVAACRGAGVRFGCTVQCRVRRAIQAIRGAVQAGRFGALLHADAYMKWFRPAEYYRQDAWRSLRRAGAGVTVQHAFHYIDLLQYLAGPAARVQAQMTNLAHPGVQLEDTLLAVIQFTSGAQGVVQASTALWPGTDVRIEINGTEGTAIMVGERVVTWQFRDERLEDQEIRTYGSAAQATGASSATAFGFADHQVVIQDMIDAVREQREVIIPVETVRPTLEIVLAMYQAAARQTTVELPVTDDDSVWNA